MDAFPFVMLFLVTAALIAWWIIDFNIKSKKHQAIRSSVRSTQFKPYTYLMDNWVISSTRQKGFCYERTPGCYVILIFDRLPDAGYTNYSHSYVGQSKNVTKRVHDHFTGKSGKPEIYNDISRGMMVYYTIVTCTESELNSLERQLIAAYGRKRSYNKTAGGGAYRNDTKYRFNSTTVRSVGPVGKTLPVHDAPPKEEYDSRSLDFYDKAIQGDPDATYMVGRQFENIGDEKNNRQAFYWYKKAADQGHKISMSKVAEMYREGKGVERNLGKSEQIMKGLNPDSGKVCRQETRETTVEERAAKGDPDAMYQLGLSFYSVGGLKNQSNAAFWFRKAADAGHDGAKFKLAGMYRNGEGVDRDTEIAKRMFHELAQKGYPGAQNAFERLRHC